MNNYLPYSTIPAVWTATIIDINECQNYFISFFFLFQDAFFYCLVFDPSQKTLLADKGEIRVGSRYQTEVTNLLKEGK